MRQFIDVDKLEEDVEYWENHDDPKKPDYDTRDIEQVIGSQPIVEAIPIAWLKQWEEKHKNDPCYCGFVSEEIIKDWEKENEIDNLLPNCVKHAKVMKEIENQLEDRNGK